MCLTINKAIHKEFDAEYNIPKPFVADEDIMVLKELIHLKWSAYVTPYYGACVCFNEDGIATLESLKKGVHRKNSLIIEEIKYPFGIEDFEIGKFYVAEGVHSYIRQDINSTYYYAIIPKGSYYYIGIDNDMVSDKLIIFKDKESYEKYAKKNSLA